MDKEKKKNPFPSFLIKMNDLLKNKKYEQIITETKDFMRNNFITMKEENMLKEVLKIATLEFIDSLKAVDYSKMSRDKLLKEIFKTTIINIFAKAEFIEKVGPNGTKKELDYILEQLRNPNWIALDVVNILSIVARCFPSFEGRVTFWNKNKKKNVSKSIKDFREAKKPSGFYSVLEREIEENLFKEPSLVNLGKDLCREIYIEYYGFAPNGVSPEGLAQDIVKKIRETLNSIQSKLKN